MQSVEDRSGRVAARGHRPQEILTQLFQLGGAGRPGYARGAALVAGHQAGSREPVGLMLAGMLGTLFG